MMYRAHDVARRTRAQLAALFALAIVCIAPLSLRALEAAEGPGAGTQYVECSNQAWKDYNSCLVQSTWEWEKKICDIAFSADQAFCISVYYRRLVNGK